jgi:hypothetical protein
MQKYELRIETRDGEWHTADLGNETPYMNFQVNKIGDLKTRTGGYSQEIRLPKTGNNCRILDMLQHASSGSRFPYERHQCRLYVDGIPVAGKGSIFQVREVRGDVFACQIGVGNADFFETLKNREFSELNLDWFEVTKSELARWKEKTDKEGYFANNSDPYELLYATFVARKNWPAGVKPQFITGPGAIFPFVKVKAILEKVLEGFPGYSFECSINDYENDLLSIADLSDVELTSEEVSLKYIKYKHC